LAHNDFVTAVDTFGEAEERVNKSIHVDMGGIVAQGVENGFHFEMRVGEGIDGDFEIGFEGRAVGTKMEIDGIDRGHKSVSKNLPLALSSKSLTASPLLPLRKGRLAQNPSALQAAPLDSPEAGRQEGGKMLGQDNGGDKYN